MAEVIAEGRRLLEACESANKARPIPPLSERDAIPYYEARAAFTRWLEKHGPTLLALAEKGLAVEQCLAHRCIEHRFMPPMNSSVMDGSECGICVAEEVTYCTRKKGHEGPCNGWPCQPRHATPREEPSDD